MLIARYDNKNHVLDVIEPLNFGRDRFCGYITPFGLCAHSPGSRLLLRIFRNPGTGQVTGVKDRLIGAYWSLCFIDAEDHK